MHVNNIPVRYAGQIMGGANYAAAYPGENVELFFNLEHAREWVDALPLNDGVQVILFKVSPHDSHGEVISATYRDAAEGSHLVEVGPRGGVKVTRIV